MFGFEKLFGSGEEKEKGKYDRYTLAGALSALVTGDKIDPDNVFDIVSSACLTDEEIKSVVEAFSVEGALDSQNFDIIRKKVLDAVAGLNPEEEALEA